MTKLKLRGSYTVEAACLSGLFLLVIFASLFLIIGTLHHSIRTNASLEASELGSIQSVRKNQDGSLLQISESTGKQVVILFPEATMKSLFPLKNNSVFQFLT